MNIQAKIKIINETELLSYNFENLLNQNYVNNYKIYDNYDKFISDLRNEVEKFEIKDLLHTSIEYKINNFKKGIWNVIIILDKQYKQDKQNK